MAASQQLRRRFGTREFKMISELGRIAALFVLFRGIPGLECFRLRHSVWGATVPLTLQFLIILNLNHLGVASNAGCQLGIPYWGWRLQRASW